MARALGSYPKGRGFKSNFRYHGNIVAMPRPGGQAAKTPPFHGGNTGSIPVRVTKRNKSELLRDKRCVRICFLLLNYHIYAVSGLSQMPKLEHLRQPFSVFFVLKSKKSFSGIKKSMTKKDCQESFFLKIFRNKNAINVLLNRTSVDLFFLFSRDYKVFRY